ncbi:hypothetical protein PIB30_011480 [Stylosanthes scabra]|uniref:Uncharacterized protein n=1 Tax=Stylosanthes scabra TaxID=79078 RepID=A0ABU6S655_9FABA|nr:hypothetical protein [Stylosanthes scabra]
MSLSKIVCIFNWFKSIIEGIIRYLRDARSWRRTRKRDRSVVEQRADDLLSKFSANLEQATQQAQEEGDESATTVDPNLVWRQTLSEPCKNRVYGGGSSASATSTHTGLAAFEIVDLKEQLRKARAEEHLRRNEEMQRQMVTFYNPLRPGSSATAGGSGSSTVPPLPPDPPPQHPNHEDDDDDDYEDA